MNRRQKIRNCFKSNTWLTCKDVENMLPEVKSKTISSYLSQLSNDGHIEREPISKVRKRRGSPMRYKLPENNDDAKRTSTSNDLLTKLVNELVQEKILAPVEERINFLKQEIEIYVGLALYAEATEYQTRLNETLGMCEMFTKKFL